MDLTHIEAYLRNWLIWLGKATGLPLAGRDWEFAALAVVALIALWIFLWPTRRAFRRGNPLRWIVVALNLASGWFWPLWIFALLLSGISRSTPLKLPQKLLQPHSAPAPAPEQRGVPAALADVVKAVQALAAKRQQGGSGGLGPWGKHARPGTAAPPVAPALARPSGAPMRAAAVPRNSRPSVVPQRQTWVRRR